MRDSRPKQKVKAWTCGCSFLTPKEAGGPQHTGTAETHLAHASVHHEVPERRWRGHFTILGCKAHPGKGTKKEGPAMDGARGGTAFLWGAWPGTALPLVGKQDLCKENLEAGRGFIPGLLF